MLYGHGHMSCTSAVGFIKGSCENVVSSPFPHLQSPSPLFFFLTCLFDWMGDVFNITDLPTYVEPL